MCMRGLKDVLFELIGKAIQVASYVDAWIEREVNGYKQLCANVASYVDAWIESLSIRGLPTSTTSSHPMWMRGLKEGSANRPF